MSSQVENDGRRVPAKAARRGSKGDAWVWLTGSALAICLLMIAGLITVILFNGLTFFWPQPLEQVTLKDGQRFLGEVVAREPIPNPGHPDHLQRQRLLLRVGNRDLLGFDFKWIDESEVASREHPADAWFIERREYGPLLGTLVRVKRGEQVVAEGAEAAARALPELVERAERDRDAIRRIEKDEIGDINARTITPDAYAPIAQKPWWPRSARASRDGGSTCWHNASPGATCRPDGPRCSARRRRRRRCSSARPRS